MSRKLIGTNFEVDPPLPRVEEDYVFGSEAVSGELVYLGRIAERRDYYRKALLDVGKAKVVAILGKRGSGKSYTLGVLMESLTSKSGQTSNLERKPAVVLLDTLNIFWTCAFSPDPKMEHDSIKTQLKNLKIWELSPEKLSDVNILVPAGFRTKSTPSMAKEFYIETSEILPQDWAFLLGLDLFRDPMGQLLNTIYEKVIDEGWTQKGKKILPRKKYAVSDLIDCILHDKEISSKRFGFHVNVRRALASKFKSIQQYPLFSTKGTEMADLIKSRNLTILLLADVPSDIRCVIASILFRKLLALQRTSSLLKKREIVGDVKGHLDMPILPPLWVMVDEAQNIIPAESFSISSPSLVELVRVGRNFGISVAFTTQQPAAIDQRIMAQVDTLIVHKLTVATDIDKIVKNSKTAPPDKVSYGKRTLQMPSLFRTLPIGYAIVSNESTSREFIMQVRERVTVHGGFEV